MDRGVGGRRALKERIRAFSRAPGFFFRGTWPLTSGDPRSAIPLPRSLQTPDGKSGRHYQEKHSETRQPTPGGSEIFGALFL